jgi:hypothetical protein
MFGKLEKCRNSSKINPQKVENITRRNQIELKYFLTVKLTDKSRHIQIKVSLCQDD